MATDSARAALLQSLVKGNAPLSNAQSSNLTEQLLAEIALSSGGGGGGGGGGTPSDVSAGIDASVDIDTILTRLTSLVAQTSGASLSSGVASGIDASADMNNVLASLSTIQAALTNAPLQYNLVLDNTDALWVQRINRATSTIDFFDPVTGTVGTPVGPLKLNAQESEVELKERYFEAITNVSGDWAVGDILTRVQVINSTTGTALSTIWYSQNGTPTSAAPVIGTDVTVSQRVELDQLRALQAIAQGGNTLLNTIVGLVDALEPTLGTTSDPSLLSPATAGSLLGTLRGLWTSLLSLQATSIGQPTDAVTSAPTASGSIIAKLGGFWTQVQARLGAPGDPALGTPSGASGLIGTLKGFWSQVNSELGTIDGRVAAINSKFPALGLNNEGNSVSVRQASRTRNYVGGNGATANASPNVTPTSTGVVDQLIFTNESGSTLYLHKFTSATAPTTGSTPDLWGPIRVPNNSTLILNSADFGVGGTFYPQNTRFAISTTRATFTPNTNVNVSLTVGVLPA